MCPTSALGGPGWDRTVPVAEALEGRRLLAAAPAAPQVALVADVTVPAPLEAGFRYWGEVATITGLDIAAFRPHRGPKAVIQWGDGRRDVDRTEARADGAFVASLPHYMYQGAGTYTLRVTFRVRGRVLARVSESVQVTEPTGEVGGSRAVGFTLDAVARQPVSGALGMFRVSSGDQVEAFVEWGDGSESDATLEVLPDGTYRVSGSHTYRRPGTYIVTVSAWLHGVGGDPPPPSQYVRPLLLSKIIVRRA
jgi:hypothetical protein